MNVQISTAVDRNEVKGADGKVSTLPVNPRAAHKSSESQAPASATGNSLRTGRNDVISQSSDPPSSTASMQPVGVFTSPLPNCSQ